MGKILTDDEVAQLEGSRKKFISDEEMAAIEGGQPGMLESAARGGAQGISLGFADELVGAGGAALDSVKKLSTEDIVKDYISNRDKYRENDAAAKKANPWTYGLSEVGGGVATGLVPGLNIASGATKAARVAKAAGLGSVVGLGTSDADLTEGDVGGAAWDAAKGGTIGAVAQRYIGERFVPKGTAAPQVADDITTTTAKVTQGQPEVNIEDGRKWATQIFGGETAENADEIAKAVTNISGESNVPGYLLTNDRPKKILADSLLNEPSIGGALTRKEMKPVYDGLENFGKEVAEQASTLTPNEAGTVVQKGVSERFKELIRPAEEIYDEVEEKFANVPLEKLAFKRGLNQLRKKFSTDFTGSSKSLIDNIENTVLGSVDDAGNQVGGLNSVAELRKFRTNLGKYLNKANASDAEKEIVGELYGIATRERDRSILKNAVKTGPKLTRPDRADALLGKVKEADRIYREGVTGVSDALGIQGTAKQSTRGKINEYLSDTAPEQITKDLFNKGDVNRLRKIKELFPEQFEVLRQRQVSDLVAQSTEKSTGRVVPARLIGNIQKLPPEVQEFMLGDLAKKAKDAQTVMGALPRDYNPSHTSHAMNWNNLFTPDWYLKNAYSIPKRMQLTAGTPTAEVLGAASKSAPQSGINLEVVTQKLSSNPASKKFVGALQNAAKNGQESLAATHFILSQTEPEYQKAVQE